MTTRALTRAEVRMLDVRAVGDYGLPTLILMENAGRGAAAWLLSRLANSSTRVVIACGTGNNGGDGAVVARHLDAQGIDVHVVWFTQTDRLQGDAAVQHHIIERAGIPHSTRDPHAVIDERELAQLFMEADWLVDALLGTGLARSVDGPLRQVIEAMNHSRKPILALDLPSGLDADSGLPLGTAIRATATTTFVAPKVGFNAPGAYAYTGEIIVVDIGLPRVILEPYRV